MKPTRKGSIVAQKIQTVFIDDVDGSEAEGTVRFGLDGAQYEIDLNDAPMACQGSDSGLQVFF
jgi:Lsr2